MIFLMNIFDEVNGGLGANCHNNFWRSIAKANFSKLFLCIYDVVTSAQPNCA